MLKNETIHTLKMSFNEVGDDAAVALSKAITKGATNLTRLELEDCQIGDHGGKALAAALNSDSTGIKYLNLKLNDLTDVCGSLFLQALSTNKIILKLNLDCCAGTKRFVG